LALNGTLAEIIQRDTDVHKKLQVGTVGEKGRGVEGIAMKIHDVGFIVRNTSEINTGPV
jgi:hypothetical protein